MILLKKIKEGVMELPAIVTGWHGWLILAILLGIGEMLTAGFVLLCFSLGAIVTSFASAGDLSFSAQLFTFAVSSLIFFLSVRKFFLRLFKSKEVENTNVSALIGKEAVVTIEINNNESKGRVKIGGEDWSARTADDSILPVDARAIVEKIDGNKVIVIKK